MARVIGLSGRQERRETKGLIFMGLKRLLRETVGRLRARLSRRYYYEDYVRVYPDGIAYDRSGRRREAKPNDRANFLNHQKFYRFAAQFVAGRRVADLGCGSGHGCRVLAEAGASRVWGADVSEEAVAFARERYGDAAEFTAQSVTDLAAYPDASVEVAISSEVLEHVKEYGVAGQAVAEMRRITADGGLLIIETPNSEMLANHGFSYDEIVELFGRPEAPAAGFSAVMFFESALAPFGERRALWEERRAAGRIGTVVSENINLAETVIPESARDQGPPQLKRGLEPGTLPFAGRQVDTRLLHNTHGWVVLAVNRR